MILNTHLIWEKYPNELVLYNFISMPENESVGFKSYLQMFNHI